MASDNTPIQPTEFDCLITDILEMHSFPSVTEAPSTLEATVRMTLLLSGAARKLGGIRGRKVRVTVLD